MPYLLVVAALVLLVVVHELGHFLAARAVGVRATKFYIFFPPALFKRKIGDVEYGIGAIPAGGFVKLPGMFAPEPAVVAQRVAYAVEQLPSIPSDAALTIDAAQRRIRRALGPDELVEPLAEISEAVRELPESPERTKFEGRMEELADELHPRAYWRAALWRRMTVIFAGPLVNLVVAFFVLVAFYAWLDPTYRTDGPMGVAKVTKSSPAAEAGLTSKSEITGWNGEVVDVAPADLGQRIFESRGKPVELTFTQPDGESLTRTIEPRDISGDGTKDELIGLMFETPPLRKDGYRDTSVMTAIRITGTEMRDITWGNVSRLPQVFFREEVRRDVSSVVGIVQVAEDVDRAGWILRYVGIISLVLAVMNLLPLLPLDGGHLLFGVIEAFRKRPLPRMVFERYSMFGFAIVLVLFLIGLNNDVGPSSG